MKFFNTTALALSTVAFLAGPALADINVVASIKPVHGLVAAVMGDIGSPALIVDGAASPHTFSLKPSHATALQNAQVIFWVGHELESFLEKPLESLGNNAKIVSLIDDPALQTLMVREEHGEDEHAEEGEHQHEGKDAHIWLDPENAKAMLKNIAATLSAADPSNAATYQSNSAAEILQIAETQTAIAAQLSTLNNKRYVVFHDAYQYFEKRFGLLAPTAISVHPENPPGAEKLKLLRQDISNGNAACVFAEPQFDQKLVTLITEGTSVKTGILDPLGSETNPGPHFYSRMLLAIASSLQRCLS